MFWQKQRFGRRAGGNFPIQQGPSQSIGDFQAQPFIFPGRQIDKKQISSRVGKYLYSLLQTCFRCLPILRPVRRWLHNTGKHVLVDFIINLRLQARNGMDESWIGLRRQSVLENIGLAAGNAYRSTI